MKTVEIVDGDVAVNLGTGVIGYVEAIVKGSQDVARHLLTNFSLFFQEGNELLDLQVEGAVVGLSEGLVVQMLTECINRLIIKQRNAGQDQRIVKMNQLRTRIIDLTTVVFLIEVMYQDGSVAAVVETLDLRPTQLNHLLSPDSVFKI